MESNLIKTYVDGIEILCFNLSPNVQIQSGLDDRDREYFTSIFEKGNPSKSELEEFVHSRAADLDASTAMSLGAKMIAYSDGRVVLGKAPYHAYLSFRPNKSGEHFLEGYFNMKSKSIKISHVPSSQSILFKKIEIWKKIIKNLLDSNLIDFSWTIIGCPPSCEDDSVLVSDLLSQKQDVEEDFEKSRKEKETEAIVQNFRTQQAFQNKNKNLMGYMYRYGENKK